MCFVDVNDFPLLLAFAQSVEHKAHEEYTQYVGICHHENCKSKRSVVSATILKNSNSATVGPA